MATNQRLHAVRARALHVGMAGLPATLVLALLVSSPQTVRGENTPSFAQPSLTPEQRQRLDEAAQDHALAPWQRQFMTAMSRDEQARVAGGHRAKPGRATRGERATSADGTWIRQLLQDVRIEHTAIYDPVRDRMVVFGGAAGQDQDVWALSLSGSPGWTRLTPSGTPPSARTGHTAIYDPLRDRMVVFGGDHNPSPNFDDLLNDVWSLSLAGSPQWTPLTPSGTPPSPRSGHTAIYDAVRDRMVVYGGGGYLGDVWALSLAGSPAWTPLSPAGTLPSPRREHTAIYDPVRDRMVVFGGASGSQPYDYHNDVWALSLAGTPAWTQLTPAGTPPVQRQRHSAIYDPVRDGVVVFGGYVADTWFLSLGFPAWTQLTPAGTPPVVTQDHTAIYDPVRDRMVVYGGMVYDGPSTDVWVLSPPAGSPAWTRLTAAPPAPPAQDGPPAYDSVHDRMVVLSSSFSEAWALSLASSPAWAQITPTGTPPLRRLGYSSIYDPVRDRVVVFGGRGTDTDVWALSLAGTPTWTQLTPSGTPPRGRDSHTAIYDPVRDRMVVFGGSAGSNPDNALNDTWVLSLSGSPAWVQIGPRAGLDNPDGRNSHSAIYDPVRDCMMMFGGRDNSGFPFNDVWTLSLADRIWTQLTPSGTPPSPRSGHTAIYDSVRDRMVVFGGFGGSPIGWLQDVWSLSLAVSPAWGQLNPVGAPSTVGGTGIYDPVRDRMVVFGVGWGVAVWDLWWNSLVGVPPRAVGDALSMDPAYPNPARSDISIEFTLPRPGSVTLHIYDLSGRLVRSLTEGTLPAGSHRVHWDRRSSYGLLAPSGSYFYELRADGKRLARRIVLID